MGSCVSVHKHPESAMKLRVSFGSQKGKILIPSPVKEKVSVTVADVALRSQWSPANTGSKDEAFFDSQPWLDSDCEDDFLSINGDFTPSRGSTPVHHSFSQENKASAMEGTINSTPEQSTPDKKKRLSELFKESLRGNENADNATSADAKNEEAPIKPKSTNGTPYLWGANSERTPNGVLIGEEEDNNTLKSGQCCLPKLVSSRSFSEKRRRMMSPSPSPSPARKNLG